ncbi:MAG TPA: hypothetical protein VLI54_05660 [Bacillota bacterium]|nr:hypothetical protein [Bacillota bacterium]
MRERQEMTSHVESDDLLLSIAEQLKTPLTTIARQAELGQFTGDDTTVDAAAIRTQAAAALTLVDSYLLGLQLLREQTQLELEPVSVSSLLVDTAHDLSRFAKYYGVELELQMSGRYGPVMSHARGLKAALLSLGFSLIEAEAAKTARRPKHVTLGLHRTPQGLVTGMYGEYERLSTNGWRTALDLAGKAGQPLTSIATGSGAGLFVADTILRSMNSRLHVGQYQHQRGLAATLEPSQQLQFV